MRYPVGPTGSRIEFEDKWYVAQGFGNPTSYGYHDGADINLKTGGNTDLGQELKAIANGRIVYYHNLSHPNTANTFGRHLVYKIDGPWGTRWVHYAHCQDITAEVKDVNEGDIIAHLGTSGTTTAHCHWAIYKVDPATVGGIDNIANTLNELNSLWENPIDFVNNWLQPAPTPPPLVPSDAKYDFGEGFGIIEVQAAASIMKDQKALIDNQNLKLNQARVKVQEMVTLLV